MDNYNYTDSSDPNYRRISINTTGNLVQPENVKVAMITKLCGDLVETYRRKNSDYGDSFASLREEFPESILIRLSDKLNRLKSLYRKKDVEVSDESVNDTLLDMAGYCLMELVERELSSNK